MHCNIQTNRLILRVLGPESANLVLDFYQRNKDYFEPWDPIHLPSFYTLAFHQINLNIEQNQMQQSKFIRYYIFLKSEPNKIIGTVCYQNFLGPPYQSCMIGYKIDQAYIRCGYATEAIIHSLHVIASKYRIHRIEALISPNNISSIALIKKCNFIYEGISYSSVKLNHTWEDYLRYAYILD